jgi:hypothetical protein
MKARLQERSELKRLVFICMIERLKGLPQTLEKRSGITFYSANQIHIITMLVIGDDCQIVDLRFLLVP